MSLKFRKFVQANKKLKEGKKNHVNGYYLKNGKMRMLREFSGKSKTQQGCKDDCDINKIVAKHPMIPLVQPEHIDTNYGDFTGVTNFKDMLDTVLASQQTFLELPSDVRKEMRNPEGMIAFCANPDNLERARELGLADMPIEETPILVKNVDAAAPSTEKGSDVNNKGNEGA